MISKIRNVFFRVISFILVFFQSIGVPGTICDYFKPDIAAPTGLGAYSDKEYRLVSDADFYVSTSGSDENDGSIAAPFATIGKARDSVRALDKTGKTGITVAVKTGEYRTSGIEFTAGDSGTAECPITYCAYGDGEVIINGGVTLAPESFSSATDEATLSRLSADAKSNVVCTNLTELGLTADDWGKIYSFGFSSTADKYDGDNVGGTYSELFMDDTRMTLARYPNEGFLGIETVLETGNGYSDGMTVNENWNDIRNPKSDTYKINSDLTARIASWKTLDDVWMFGFWKYTWADATSPVGSFDAEAGTLSPKFVSFYGTTEGAPYYFFNVFEELDAPGEWYLDRANGILYMYPLGNMSGAQIDMSLTSGNIITVNNANYLTFKGFTVKGTRGNAMELTGNNLTVRSCVIKNIGENALFMTGYSNIAADNEITHTGKGGITLTGGDRATLTPGNSRAENNLIHDWSEISQTYQPAVTLNGVGNVCAHNEIYNSPHEAITYTGNNHMIEYNNIHDVCLLSDDAGAIYSGRRWDWYGTVIRYNAVYDLGSGEHTPNGIYMDDALSGQTIYGNLLVNIPGYAVLIGGGRDVDLKNNIIVNSGNASIIYDQRARDGALNNGWFNHSIQNGDMWQLLNGSPWQSEVWQKAFPEMTRFSDNFNDSDSPDFVPNPAYSDVSGNLIVNSNGNIGEIADSVTKFSNINDNAVYRLWSIRQIFTDPENGDYTFNTKSPLFRLLPGFEEIPFGKIGRIVLSEMDIPAELTNTKYILDNGTDLTVGYIGGSITVGAGASDELNCWRSKTTEMLQKAYPDVTVTEVNAAIGGTGSDFGLFRCDDDLLSKNPDLVFIEFAVNDSGKSYDAVRLYTESLVRKIYAKNPSADIVLVLTVAEGMLSSVLGGTCNSYNATKDIAKHYGLMLVDMSYDLRQLVTANDCDIKTYLPDGVHPNDKCYGIYADRMEYMLKRCLVCKGSNAAKELPGKMGAYFTSAGMIDASAAVLNGFAANGEPFGRYNNPIVSDRPGDSFTIEFEGTVAGLCFYMTDRSGDYLWSVDGSSPVRASTWDEYCKSFNREGFTILTGQLSPGKHILTVTVCNQKNPESLGTHICVGSVLYGTVA